MEHVKTLTDKVFRVNMLSIGSKFSQVPFASVGSEAFRTHTSREKFLDIINFNPAILRKFQINLPGKIIKHTVERPTLTAEDVGFFYDELLTHCSCKN